MDFKQCARFAMIIFISFPLFAQDEKVFRDLYLNNEREKVRSNVKKQYRLKARSNRHHIDLNGDNRQESFYTAKRDGENWIHFFDPKGNEIFSAEIDANGPWSRFFKIQMRELSKDTKILMLYFYEGVTKYLEFQGTSRLYFITIDNNDLKTMALYKGPLLWDENRGFKDHYHQRKYEVSLFDLDADYVREVAVKYGRMTRVYKYLGKGQWFNFDDEKVNLSF